MTRQGLPCERPVPGPRPRAGAERHDGRPQPDALGLHVLSTILITILIIITNSISYHQRYQCDYYQYY